MSTRNNSLRRIHGLRPPGGDGLLGMAMAAWLFAGAAAGIAATSAAPATGSGVATRSDGLSQAEVGQKQLQSTTTAVSEQLGRIIEEFERNDLRGEDLELLQAIRGVLSHLSAEDMARIVELLRSSRETSGAEKSAALFEAFSTQKSVGLKLRQILLEYRRQQELAAVAARLDALAQRQQAAMWETLQLVEGVNGRRREWLTENQRILLQLQTQEQQSLRDEARSVLERLQAWSVEGENDEAGRVADVLELPEAMELARVLSGTARDLETSHLMSAVGQQRRSRDLLRELARQLLPAPDELEALQMALGKVRTLIARQEVIRDRVRPLAERSAERTDLTWKQVELVDATDILKREVAALDIVAGEQVEGAVARMQEARGALEAGPEQGAWRGRRQMASTQQELALARLESARRLLEQRIDTLEKQRAATADPVSNLQQVREDVAELLRMEQELKADAAKAADDPAELRPMAPRQGDLGDRAGDTASRAALDSMEAAEQIQEAVSQMRQSQRNLGEGRNDPGAQQAAIDALSKALSSLDQQLAALEAAQKEMEELEDLLALLVAVIEAEQKLMAETARLARGLEGRPSTQVSSDQIGLVQPTREIEGKVPLSVAQAATYLRDAGNQMLLAGSALAGDRPAEAREPQDDALANLLRAKRELEERLAQLQQMLGMPPEGPSLQELAQLIKEAQQDVNQAMSAEELMQMAQNLAQANQRVQPATSGRMGRIPGMIRQPLEAAERALSEGAAAAEGGDQAMAMGQAGAAQEALAAAAAALDLAMAGMGQGGEGQGGQGQRAGQGQERGRGRAPGAQSGKGTGDAGNFFGAGGGDGPRRSTQGGGEFIGLPARERAALLQSQGETYPQEYAPQIEQYLKNLSDRVENARDDQ